MNPFRIRTTERYAFVRRPMLQTFGDDDLRISLPIVAAVPASASERDAAVSDAYRYKTSGQRIGAGESQQKLSIILVRRVAGKKMRVGGVKVPKASLQNAFEPHRAARSVREGVGRDFHRYVTDQCAGRAQLGLRLRIKLPFVANNRPCPLVRFDQQRTRRAEPKRALSHRELKHAAMRQSPRFATPVARR